MTTQTETVLQLMLQVIQPILKVLTPPWFPKSLVILDLGVTSGISWTWRSLVLLSILASSSLSLCGTLKCFSSPKPGVNHLPLNVSLENFYRAQLEENEQKVILNLRIFTLNTATPCSSPDFHILLLNPRLQNLAAI